MTDNCTQDDDDIIRAPGWNTSSNKTSGLCRSNYYTLVAGAVNEALLYQSFIEIRDQDVTFGHGYLNLATQTFTTIQSATDTFPSIISYSAFGYHPERELIYGITDEQSPIRTLYQLDINTGVVTNLASVDLEPDIPDVAGATVVGNELWVLIANTTTKADNNGQIYIFDLDNPTNAPTLLQDGGSDFNGQISPNHVGGGGSGDIVIDPDTVGNDTIVFYYLEADTIFKVTYNTLTDTAISDAALYTIPALNFSHPGNGSLGIIGDKLYLYDKDLNLIEVDKNTGVGTTLFNAPVPDTGGTGNLLSALWADMSQSIAANPVTNRLIQEIVCDSCSGSVSCYLENGARVALTNEEVAAMTPNIGGGDIPNSTANYVLPVSGMVNSLTITSEGVDTTIHTPWGDIVMDQPGSKSWDNINLSLFTITTSATSNADWIIQ